MQRIVSRNACMRALRHSFVASSCQGPSAHFDLLRGLHPSYTSDNTRGCGNHSNRTVMPSCLADREKSSFGKSSIKELGMARVIWAHTYSSATNTQEKVSDEMQRPNPSPKKTLDDFQHEEIVGPTVERDKSLVADELRLAQLEMRGVMKKFSQAVLALGTVHLIWGGMMFRLLDSPFSHALMTQVCATAMLLFGLGYYSKQSLKAIEFFTRLEERSRLQILTLSLQVTKSLNAFFHRVYGVGLVLLVVLTANLVGSLMFLY